MTLLLTIVIAGTTLSRFEGEIKAIRDKSTPYIVTVTAGDVVSSGTVVDDKGHIVTGLLPDVTEFEVKTWDGKELKASIVGKDEVMGLTLIAIGEKLPAPKSSSKTETGDLAIVIGNPIGVKKTVQLGLVSGLREDGRFYLSIPSEIALTGAGVFNSKGELMGVLSSTLCSSRGITGLKSAVPGLFQNSNLFLMVPIDTIKNRIQRIIKFGNLREAWLGIAAFSSDKGVLVKMVIPGSPAEKAGLRKYDIIIEADGTKVTSPVELKNIIKRKKPGDRIELVVKRGKKKEKIYAELDKKPFYFRKIVPFEYPELAAPQWKYEKLKEEIEKYRKEMEALTDSLRKELKRLKELRKEDKSRTRI